MAQGGERIMLVENGVGEKGGGRDLWPKRNKKQTRASGDEDGPDGWARGMI